MRLLLDTHILIWAASSDEEGARGLPPRLATLLLDPRNELYFSAAAIWEIGVKSATRRGEFVYDAKGLRTSCQAAGYFELAIDGAHGVAAGALPPIHKDPFDRIMIAQAQVEGLTFVTRDEQVLRYPGAMLRV